MAKRARVNIQSVPIGTDVSGALAAHLVERYRDDPLGLADVLLLLPNNRAIGAMTAAFVRSAENGLMLPRMVAVGDLEIDEKLGPIIDPLDIEAETILPSITPVEQLLLYVKLVRRHKSEAGAAEALHLAKQLVQTLSELDIEEKSLKDVEPDHAGADLAAHWSRAYDSLQRLCQDVEAEMAQRGLVSVAQRRNKLLRRLGRRFADDPPPSPVIAAGITTAAPAIAYLLAQVARMPSGLVLLPHVDHEMSDEEWDALGDCDPGTSSSLPAPDQTQAKPVQAHRMQESHPQFHLKLLLHRMGVARDEVEPFVKPQKRLNEQVRDIFCVPDRTVEWQGLSTRRRMIGHVRLIEAEDSAEEARAIATAIRQAVETPGRRVALVTPDREIAARVSAQLRRWGIEADDSAGEPLSREPEGRLFLAISQMLSRDLQPVALFAVLKHPLVATGDGRIAWLEEARALDLALRGPQMQTGAAAIREAITRQIKHKRAEPDLLKWWVEVENMLAEHIASAQRNLRGHIDAVAAVADNLTRGEIWKGIAGRSLSQFIEQYAGEDVSPLDDGDVGGYPDLLSSLLGDISVRRPFGKHPRVAIYGLLEARLQSADFLICAGLNEGTWPQLSKPDPWLAPHLRRRLGLPGLERTIGLSAHDLASALGAPEVLLIRAKRDRSGPTIASRFLLRMQALFGANLETDSMTLALARNIDQPERPAEKHGRPRPAPSAAQRKVAISITQMDMLRSDPFAFYARNILSLDALKSVDAEPDAAWKGTLVHDIIDEWTKSGSRDTNSLVAFAESRLAANSVAPALRLLWKPRIVEGLRWVAAQTEAFAADGRQLLQSEVKAEGEIDGIKVHGRVDRIDRTADGKLVVIDYKTGSPPKKSKVKAGYALQLGLAGALVETGGVKDVSGEVAGYEYWSLAKNKGTIGHVASPFAARPKAGDPDAAVFASFAEDKAREAIGRWINGSESFTAKLKPDYAVYRDYDQLMRLDEWIGRTEWSEADGS